MTMTIQEFLHKYGTNSTSNFNLLRWASGLGIKLHVLMRNELKKLTNVDKKSPAYIICNYQTTKDVGTHWVAMYKNKEHSFYFDSYSIQPFPEAIDFLGGGIYSTFKIQPDGSKICGQLCLFVLYKLSRGDDFYDTIFELTEFFRII